MRNIKIYQFKMVLVGLCYAFSSCSFLDVVPDNIATLDNAFSDKYTAEKYLTTCYSSLPKSAGWNQNPALLGACEAIFNKERQTNAGMKFAMGLNNASNPLIDYWSSKGDYENSLFAGIRDCNIFLENIDRVQDLQSFQKNRMKAEVKLVKAYLHFFLTIYYGPIPPLKENIPVNESTTGVRVYREKVDDCFMYITELLDEVINSEALPKYIENNTTELGRFTQAAAYAIKAKVLMFWASPLFNGNSDYNSFFNEKGEPFFNQTYDASRWLSAAEACKNAIDKCSEVGIRLYQIEDYVSSKPMSDETRLVNTLRSSVSERWNCELIWGLTTYPANSGIQSACLPRFQQGTSSSASGIYSVSLNTIEKFYSANGVPINEDLSYDYSNRYNIKTGDESHKYYIKKGEQTSILNFNREPRFYSTLGFDRGLWYGNGREPENDEESWFPKNRFGEYSSVFNPGDYNVTGYWPKKLIPLTTVYRDANSITYEAFPWPEIRFADLILYYAEALNEISDAPTNDVYSLVDMIRNRAGLKGVVESWTKYSSNPTKPNSKSGMREIIRREREIELSCEGAYFWDHHRWKTANKEFNRVVQGWNVKSTDPLEYYMVTNILNQKFTYRDYFAPIPESDMVRNPQLIQNPGW